MATRQPTTNRTGRGKWTSDLTRSPTARSVLRAALTARALATGLAALFAVAAPDALFFAAATRLAAGPRFFELDGFFLPGAPGGRVLSGARPGLTAGSSPESGSESSGVLSRPRRALSSSSAPPPRPAPGALSGQAVHVRV